MGSSLARLRTSKKQKPQIVAIVTKHEQEETIIKDVVIIPEIEEAAQEESVLVDYKNSNMFKNHVKEQSENIKLNKKEEVVYTNSELIKLTRQQLVTIVSEVSNENILTDNLTKRQLIDTILATNV